MSIALKIIVIMTIAMFACPEKAVTKRRVKIYPDNCGSIADRERMLTAIGKPGKVDGLVKAQD